MKFTLSWLKDHLETTATLDEITTKLSAIGLEVDGVENPGEKLSSFRIARVLEAKRHPDAPSTASCLVQRATVLQLDHYQLFPPTLMHQQWPHKNGDLMSSSCKHALKYVDNTFC